MTFQPLFKSNDPLEDRAQGEENSLLRFLTCGSVDDGKSTLIGRLLYDSKVILEDQLETLEKESKNSKNLAGDLDFSLLLDGLNAEREQGITIDVAYRFFSTNKRKFIVADTPGHEQYTKNMATGASTADLAIILIDARKGVLTQTRRHSYIANLLGIKNVLIAVNKMDLIGFNQETFNNIQCDYSSFAAGLEFSNIDYIPISALKGDNIVGKSTNFPWYSGPSLLDYLENIEVDENKNLPYFSMPVQWINRPNLDFRGITGKITSGILKAGDEIIVLPSNKTSTIKEIVTHDGNLIEALEGQSVTLTLKEEIDVARGDVLTTPSHSLLTSEQFQAEILWFHDTPLKVGHSYLFQSSNNIQPGFIRDLTHKINVNTLKKKPTETLKSNEVGLANVQLDEAFVFTPYLVNRNLGSFIVIDRVTNETVGCGMIRSDIKGLPNIPLQAISIDQNNRSKLKYQTPFVLWFTGLSGAGKSTIANLVDVKLHSTGKHTYLLDGDNIRNGLNKDLNFSDSDRNENIRRVSEVANLMTDAGLIVLTAFISPFQKERKSVRRIMGQTQFIEIFVDTPLSVCEKRDPKGLYKKASSGCIENFTGIGSHYEEPRSPDIHLLTSSQTADQLADQVIGYLKKENLI